MRRGDREPGQSFRGRHRKVASPDSAADGYGFRVRRIRSWVYARSALSVAHIGNSRRAVAPRNDRADDAKFKFAELESHSEAKQCPSRAMSRRSAPPP